MCDCCACPGKCDYKHRTPSHCLWGGGSVRAGRDVFSALYWWSLSCSFVRLVFLICRVDAEKMRSAHLGGLMLSSNIENSPQRLIIRTQAVALTWSRLTLPALILGTGEAEQTRYCNYIGIHQKTPLLLEHTAVRGCLCLVSCIRCGHERLSKAPRGGQHEALSHQISQRQIPRV